MLEALTVKTASLGIGVFLVGYYVIKFIQGKKYKLPPGPMALPLVGSMWKFLTEKDTVKIFLDQRRHYGPVSSLWLGPYHSVVLSDLNVITEALVTRGADFAGRPSLPSMDKFTKGGKDIALADFGPVWRVQRKMAHVAMRTFTEGDKLGNHLLENFTAMADDWKSQTEQFNPRETITLFTYNIMSSMIFGEIFNKDSEEFQYLLRLGTEAGEKLGNGFATDFLPSCFAFLDKGKIAYMDEIMDWFDALLNKRIQHHRDTFNPDNLRDLVDHILDVQMKSKDEEETNVLRQLTDDHFGLVIIDLFSGGTDTTRETLIEVLLFVGAHPEVQKKMAEELDRVIGRDRLPEAKDVTKLPYCEAVIFETMRVGSLAPLSAPHKTMCDTSVGGYDVPKGSLVLINLLELHFDPEHWESPDEFNPDRFIDEDGSVHKPRAWMPFSGGRRVCPAEFLAKRELVYITALIYHRFTVTIPEVPDRPLEPAFSSVQFRQPKEYKIAVVERS